MFFTAFVLFFCPRIKVRALYRTEIITGPRLLDYSPQIESPPVALCLGGVGGFVSLELKISFNSFNPIKKQPVKSDPLFNFDRQLIRLSLIFFQNLLDHAGQILLGQWLNFSRHCPTRPNGSYAPVHP